MRYQGGKTRLSKHIVEIIEYLRKPNQMYLEPFCGSCAITEKIKGIRIASDINSDLIAMYRALQSGWKPPDTVSEDKYKSVKNHPDDYIAPLRAFISIGCSYGGKIWGGYARDRSGKRNLSNESYRNVLTQIPMLQDVAFLSKSYREFEPNGFIIYCDPPYANTTIDGYVSKAFDNDEFWNVMRIWSEKNTVLVSEYAAPLDAITVGEWQHGVSLNNQSGENQWRNNRQEKLFLMTQDEYIKAKATKLIIEENGDVDY